MSEINPLIKQTIPIITSISRKRLQGFPDGISCQFLCIEEEANFPTVRPGLLYLIDDPQHKDHGDIVLFQNYISGYRSSFFDMERKNNMFEFVTVIVGNSFKFPTDETPLIDLSMTSDLLLGIVSIYEDSSSYYKDPNTNFEYTFHPGYFTVNGQRVENEQYMNITKMFQYPAL